MTKAFFFGAVSIANPNFGSQSVTSWVSRNNTVVTGVNDIIYGAGLFVAVGQNCIFTSPDGITWTSRTCPLNNPWTGLSYSGTQFVAVCASTVGTPSQTIMTSPDGITWTLQLSTSGSNTIRCNCTAYGNSLYIGMGSSASTTVRAISSSDGITWTGFGPSFTTNITWRSICYGGGKFVALGSSGAPVYSATGTGIYTSGTGVTSTSWADVCYGNGLYVAITSTGVVGTSVYTSSDGIAWTARTIPAAVVLSSVCYGGGLFVAVANTGSNNQIITSPNGITWTTRTNPVTKAWTAVTAGPSNFVAANADGSNTTTFMQSNG